MSYATTEDAITLYGEDYILNSVDRDDDGEPDADAFSAALTQASSEADSYLGVRWDTPLTITPIPTVLQRRIIDIAVYISSPTAGTLTDEKIERYKQAIKWFEAIAAGKAEVPGIDDPTAPIGQGATTAIVTEPRLFTRSKMKGIL